MRRIPAGIFLSFASLAVFLFSSCATTDFFPGGGAAGARDSAAGGSQPVKKSYVKEVKSHTANDRTDIKIIADGPIRFFAYRLENPNRLAIEMENMGHKLAQPQLIVNDRLVDKVTVVNFERVKKTRAEIWIKVPYTYNVEKEFATVTVTVREDPTSDAAALNRAKKVIDDLNVEIIRLKEKVDTMERREEEMLSQPLVRLDEAPVAVQPPPQAEFEPVKTEREEPPIPPVTATAHEEKTAAPQPSGLQPPPLSGGQPVIKADDDVVGVNNTLQGWREAWEAKDFDRYGNYYTPTFPGAGQARSAWLADKRKRFEKAGGIRVEIINPETNVEGGKATVRFTQRYSSGRHSDVGVKTLILVKYGDEWKIDSEDWRPGR